MKRSKAAQRASGGRRPAADDPLAALAAGFPAQVRVLLAVSGGADSTALMHLAARLPKAAARFSIATVDHGLRAGAKAEARAVAAQAKALGLPHRTLIWRGDKPETGLQAAARAARYALLAREARRIGASWVATAHTRDDQAETVLLRLARGAGVDGLAAMDADSPWPVPGGAELRLLRPLLGVSRAALRAWLASQDLPFAEDPSNGDPRFERIRIRAALPALAALGLTAERLGTTAARLGRAAQALQVTTRALAAKAVTLRPEGVALIDPAALDGQPEEIVMRLWRRVFAVLGVVTPPRDAALAAFATAVVRGPARTLAGVRVGPAGRLGAGLLATRESAAPPKPLGLKAGQTTTFDGRFRVTLARSCLPGLLQLAGRAPAPPPFDRLPLAVRRALPVLNRDGVTLWPALDGAANAPFRAVFPVTAL